MAVFMTQACTVTRLQPSLPLDISSCGFFRIQ